MLNQKQIDTYTLYLTACALSRENVAAMTADLSPCTDLHRHIAAKLLGCAVAEVNVAERTAVKSGLFFALYS